MLFSPVFLCVDDASPLGRLDYHSLPQQTLMELLIEKITKNKGRICGFKKIPKDISRWKNVFLNEHKDVTTIMWGFKSLEGSLSIEWLPATVTYLTASRNLLTGTLGLEHLPGGMRSLYLYDNRYRGTLSLRSLPPVLHDLLVNENRLSGTLDLANLPKSLKNLNLGNNGFHGSTDFSKLPASLENLNVSHTDLEGEIVVNQENEHIFVVRCSKVILCKNEE